MSNPSIRAAATLTLAACLATPAHAVIGVYDKYFVTTEISGLVPGGGAGSGYHYYNNRGSRIDALPGAMFDGGPSFSTAGSSFDTTGRLWAAASKGSSVGLSSGQLTGDSNLSVASADLSTGALRASVTNTTVGGFVQGSAFAQMHDIVTLNVAGATDQTRTRVTVQYAVDGSFGADQRDIFNNGPQVLVTARMQLQNPNSAQASLTATAFVQWNVQDPNTPVPTLIGTQDGFTNAGDVFNTGDVNSVGSWAGSTANLMTFKGSFDIIGRSVTVNPTFTLDVNCAMAASCNFGNTARFSFVNLPGNVSFTSNSGVFLSPVPEPDTYALMLAGLGVVGFMARRRGQGTV